MLIMRSPAKIHHRFGQLILAFFGLGRDNFLISPRIDGLYDISLNLFDHLGRHHSIGLGG
jgi:hypothetical protein